MKIALIGANGQLGMDVRAVFSRLGWEVLPLTHDMVDLANAEAVRRVVAETRPDCLINTAAMHHVEQCELEPAAAYAVNAIGVRALAEACAENRVYLAHISTDYVFDGRKKAPYVEEDAPLPLNVYGNSKLAGEYFVRALECGHAVLRVGGLYGAHPCRAKGGLNFVRLMLKLAAEKSELRVVDDEIVTPTPTLAIAAQLVPLVREKVPGLFHGTCQGSCSWYAFARRIFAIAGLSPNLLKARPGEFPAKTPRPSYSVLDNAHLRRLGLDCMPDWENGLESYLRTVL